MKEDKKYYDRLNENENEGIGYYIKTFLIYLIIGCAIFGLACLFSSCESEPVKAILKPDIEVSPSIIDTTLFGRYESNRGEKNAGSIWIEKDRVYINTIMTEMNLKIENIEYNHDCFIIFTLEDGVKVKLSLFSSINRITLWFIYPDDSTEYLGTFNKVIENGN